jgi:hypothetical protein
MSVTGDQASVKTTGKCFFRNLLRPFTLILLLAMSDPDGGAYNPIVLMALRVHRVRGKGAL